MKNKILIDAERTRYLSGISVVCRNLLRGLHELSQNDLKFVTYGSAAEFPSLSYRFKKWRSWHRFFHFGLKPYQLVHIFHQSNHYFPSKLKAKKIVTLHDLNFLHENLAKPKLKRNLNRVKKNLQNTDVVVCISEFVKQDYLRNQHLFEPNTAQKVEVIHNGLYFPDPEKKFGLGRFEFLRDRKYFLNIGVLFPKKNQLSILKTLPFLDEELVLVISESKKDYETEILDFVKDHQLENRVHIFRNITDDEKYSLIQHCEAMIHPSLAEGFGIPPIEAMYFGKLVFLSKLTSLPEIGGECAFYFDDFSPENMAQKIKNGMQTYRSDKTEYSSRLTKWALQYDYRKMTEEYLKLYRNTLSIS